MDSAGTVVTQFAVFVYLNDTIFLQGMQIFHLSVIRKKGAGEKTEIENRTAQVKTKGI